MSQYNKTLQIVIPEALLRAIQSMIRYSFRDIGYQWEGLTDSEKTFIEDQVQMDALRRFSVSDPSTTLDTEILELLTRATELMRQRPEPGTEPASEEEEELEKLLRVLL